MQQGSKKLWTALAAAAFLAGGIPRAEASPEPRDIPGRLVVETDSGVVFQAEEKTRGTIYFRLLFSDGETSAKAAALGHEPTQNAKPHIVTGVIQELPNGGFEILVDAVRRKGDIAAMATSPL